MNLASDTVDLRQVFMDLLGTYNKNNNFSKLSQTVLTEIVEMTSVLNFFEIGSEHR